MTDPRQTPTNLWTREKAALLAACCLLAGIMGGWLIHAPQGEASAPANPVGMSKPASANAAPAQPPSPIQSDAQMRSLADTQAAPLLDKLKAAPGNADLLVSVGNVYYDAKLYPTAADYYTRALKVRPGDAAVRTDMATALWYMGNADQAIAEFNKALHYKPNNPNTLFNLGLVKWQGKGDTAGALADWEKLLSTDPNYEGRDQVEQMMTKASQQQANRK